MPDAFVICMGLTAVVLLLAMTAGGASPHQTLVAWGDGVWTLLGLSMQFTIALVAAHAVVTSRPAFRWLDRLASVPDPERPRQAILLVGLFSVVTGYVNGAVCTVACALIVPFVARRNPNADIRLLIAAAYLGLGTVWHGGFSGSAPLIMATPDNPLLSPATGPPLVDRLIPVTETLLNPFNLGYVVVIGFTGILAAVLLHPARGGSANPVRRAGRPHPAVRSRTRTRRRTRPPVASIASRVGVWLAALLFAYPLGHSIWTRGFGESWTINAYNTVFLVAALLLHGRPLPFLRACRNGLDTAWGLILQFPLYAGIFGVMQGTGLGAWLGGAFGRIASEGSYPLLVYAYSGLVNLFVPSAGSKWFIEAPYLLPVGEEIGVSTVTVLLAYSYGDSTTNLIQPMWALPLLAVTRLRFGDVVGYTFLIAVACFAVSTVAMLLIPSTW